MKKFNDHIVNESNVSFIEGEAFEEVLMDHLKEVVGISTINMSQVRGKGANIYQFTVNMEIGIRDNINTQMKRFSEVKRLVDEIFLVRKDFMARSSGLNPEVSLKFQIEYVDLENSNFYKSVKGIDKFGL